MEVIRINLTRQAGGRASRQAEKEKHMHTGVVIEPLANTYIIFYCCLAMESWD